jgi:hypothetical protein
MKRVLALLGFASLAMLLFPVLIAPPLRTSPERDQAEAAAKRIGDALTKYYQEYGEWADGDQAHTIKAIGGDNPKGIVFLPVAENSLNANGEFTDPWGTPYRISIDRETHRVNVVSAGPDHIFQHANSRHSDDVSGAAAGGVPGLPF